MSFNHSKLANNYLAGLKGVEIGGAAHNAFGLNTINVDAYAFGSPQRAIYEAEQLRLCGHVMPVDVVAPGDKLPFTDNEFDFVISSHVIEHFYSPISAIREWVRVASKYVFIIVPHMDRTFDRHETETDVLECFERLAHPEPTPTDQHHTFWRPAGFAKLVKTLGFEIIELQDPDDKVGNGFTVVIKL